MAARPEYVAVAVVVAVADSRIGHGHDYGHGDEVLEAATRSDTLRSL